MLQEADLTFEIRACVFEVHGVLGPGFLERVYERALLEELAGRGIAARAQVPLAVRYKGVVVGEYYADIMVENRVIIEVKAQDRSAQGWEAQILHYLKATGTRLGLVVNFGGPSASVRRFVL
jgi:GxxExxY protein